MKAYFFEGAAEERISEGPWSRGAVPIELRCIFFLADMLICLIDVSSAAKRVVLPIGPMKSQGLQLNRVGRFLFVARPRGEELASRWQN